MLSPRALTIQAIIILYYIILYCTILYDIKVYQMYTESQTTLISSWFVSHTIERRH